MKKTILSLYVIILSLTVYSQNETWQKVFSDNGVEFFSRKTECHDVQNGIHEEYFLIQIHNISNNAINLKWNYHLWNNETCINCKENISDIKFFEITLQPGESVEGTCDNKAQKGLLIFSRFLQRKTSNPVNHFTVENVNVIFN